VPSDLRSDPHTRNNLVPKSNEQIANKQTKTQREREGKDFPELSTQFSVVFVMTSQPKDHNKDVFVLGINWYRLFVSLLGKQIGCVRSSIFMSSKIYFVPHSCTSTTTATTTTRKIRHAEILQKCIQTHSYARNRQN